MQQINIYTLSNPVTGEPKYIGVTNNIRRRLNGHLNDTHGKKKIAWVNALKLNGLTPSIEVIDVVNNKDRDFWEQHYISLYKSWGFDLVNSNDGGDYGRSDVDIVKKRVETLRKTGVYERTSARMKTNNPTMNPEIAKKNGQRMRVDNPMKNPEISRRVALTKRENGVNEKPVLQFDKNNVFIKEWPSATRAGEGINLDGCNISRCCNNKQKTVGGFTWKFKN